MAKETSKPPKAGGSALGSRAIEAMESRQLLSASFGHALYPVLIAPAPQPAAIVSPSLSGWFHDWHMRDAEFNGETNSDGPSLSGQSGFASAPDRFGGWSGDSSTNSSQGFQPIHQDLLRANAGGNDLGNDGLMDGSSQSPVIVSTTFVWTVSSVPGDGNVLQLAGNPLSGPGIVYERATYIITYGTIQPPTDPLEMHGPHFDGDYPTKSEYDVQPPAPAPLPAAPSSGDTLAAQAPPPATNTGRVEPHLVRANGGNSAQTTTTAAAVPVVAPAQTPARVTEVATIKPATSPISTAGSLSIVAGAAMRTVAQQIFAFGQTAPAVSGVVGEALALTGAGAATTPPAQAIVAGAQAALPQIGAIAQTAGAVHAAIHVNPIDAMSLFSDALGAFINDSVALEPVAVAQQSHRAWAITAGVVTFDAILVGHWYAQRAKQQKQEESHSPFRDGKPMLADLPLVE